MKNVKGALKKLWGFRSNTPWKKLLAVVYYVACISFLIIGIQTGPLIPCEGRDVAVVYLSTVILFLWMLSPAIFLSDTPLRDALPFFKDRQTLRSLAGMMIVFVLFQYLFMVSERLHTQAYQDAFQTYITDSYAGFAEAGESMPVLPGYEEAME